MTSTTTFGGYNVDGKQSSKVLKPPGGGSSDIFGAAEETPVRRVKNHQASKLVLEDGSGTTTPSRSITGKDTHSRLFGPPPPTPPPPPRARSNILDNGNNPLHTTEVDGSNNHQPDQNETASTNGNTTPSVVTNGNPPPARTRVPPGGFSSGLW